MHLSAKADACYLTLIAVSYQFFGWIFSLGKEVKVVEPYDVVEKMREAAKEFAANYDK